MGIKSLPLVELVDRGRDLQPLHQQSLLPLEGDVLRPSGEAGEIPLGPVSLGLARGISGPLLKERVGGLCFLLASLGGSS